MDTNSSSIKKTILDADTCQSNIENFLGAVQVPVGTAGPLKVNGKEYTIPLATTEGALVASVNRGCNLIGMSNGAESVIVKEGQTRSLLFKAKTVSIAKKFADGIKKDFLRLKSVGESTSNYLEIIDLKTYIVGRNVWLKIIADTKDAMGMNMVTIAGKKIADSIEFPGIEFISESGNMCVDKKPSAMNLIQSRGRKVVSSVTVKDEDIQKVLKCSSKDLIDLNYRKNMLGSAISGSLGFNAHFANMLAALYLATGQDMAHVVDGSLGFTLIEKEGDAVHISVTIPSIQVGTIGGGTVLPCQKEALEMLGCAGAGDPPGLNARRLAEIVGAVVLAGEISLLGALSEKKLGEAHKRLNR